MPKIDIRSHIKEIGTIKSLLINDPALACLFEIVCILCNERLNQEDIKKDILTLSLLEQTDDELDDPDYNTDDFEDE